MAVIVPLTTICDAAVVGVEVHRVAGGEGQRPVVGDRLAGPISNTEMLGATFSVAPEATVKPPGKTYCRLDVLVPIWLSASVCPAGQRAGVDVDLLEA